MYYTILLYCMPCSITLHEGVYIVGMYAWRVCGSMCSLPLETVSDDKRNCIFLGAEILALFVITTKNTINTTSH